MQKGFPGDLTRIDSPLIRCLFLGRSEGCFGRTYALFNTTTRLVIHSFAAPFPYRI